MFDVRWDRSSASKYRRAIGGLAASAALVGLMASPTLGAPGGGVSPTTPPPTIAVEERAPGGPAPANTSGQSDCAYEAWEDGHRYVDVTLTNPDGSQVSSQSVSQDTPEGQIEVARDSERRDTPDTAAEDRPKVIDVESHEIVDGGYLVGDVAWKVWKVLCGPEPAEGEEADYSIVAAPVQAGALLPDLYDYMEASLPLPVLELTPEDPDGWVYVQTPIDFRTPAGTLVPVSVTADTGGPEDIRKWSVMTATPETVVFDSGDDETDPQSVECPAAAADDPYVAEEPGACSFTFRNSSTIADGNVFDVEFSIVWTITYYDSDGGAATLAPLTSTQFEEVAVGEIKVVNVPNAN